jgi:hypothetical protein
MRFSRKRQTAGKEPLGEQRQIWRKVIAVPATR